MHELFEVQELCRLIGEYSVMILWFLNINAQFKMNPQFKMNHPQYQIEKNMVESLQQDFHFDEKTAQTLTTTPEYAIYGSFLLQNIVGETWSDGDLNIMVFHSDSNLQENRGHGLFVRGGRGGQGRGMFISKGKIYRSDRYWQLASKFIDGQYHPQEDAKFDQFVTECELLDKSPKLIENHFAPLKRGKLQHKLLELEILLENNDYVFHEDSHHSEHQLSCFTYQHPNSRKKIHISGLQPTSSFREAVILDAFPWLHNYFTHNNLQVVYPDLVLNLKTIDLALNNLPILTRLLKYHRRGFRMSETMMAQVPKIIVYEQNNDEDNEDNDTTNKLDFVKELIRNRMFICRPVADLFGSPIDVPDPTSVCYHSSSAYPHLCATFSKYLVQFYRNKKQSEAKMRNDHAFNS